MYPRKSFVVLVVMIGISGVQRNSAQVISSPLQSSSSPATPSTSEPKKQSADESQAKRQPKGKGELEIENKEQSQRILGVVPNFYTTSRRDALPLTPGQKFHLFLKGTVDPFNLGALAVQAGISQGEDEFEEYGQGAAGYAKRYGAAFADSTAAGFFSGFLYPVMLKDDPRYFRRGEGPITHRVAYSLAQQFVCRSDRGKTVANLPNIFGTFSAAALSNAYYPAVDRGFELTMSRVGISFVYGSVGVIVSEFWPDIDRKVFHKKDKAQQPPTP